MPPLGELAAAAPRLGDVADAAADPLFGDFEPPAGTRFGETETVLRGAELVRGAAGMAPRAGAFLPLALKVVA